MTDKEIQELAHTYANNEYYHFDDAYIVDVMASAYAEFLKFVLQTHDIKRQ